MVEVMKSLLATFLFVVTGVFGAIAVLGMIAVAAVASCGWLFPIKPNDPVE